MIRDGKLHELLDTMVGRFKQLDPGGRALLRRQRSGNEAMTDGIAWRVLPTQGSLSWNDKKRLADIAVLLPYAEHRVHEEGGFNFGRLLRGSKVSDPDFSEIRYRRLINCDRDRLVHQMRQVLRWRGRQVDWIALGTDIFYWGDNVRQRWNEGYFTQTGQEEGNE